MRFFLKMRSSVLKTQYTNRARGDSVKGRHSAAPLYPVIICCGISYVSFFVAAGSPLYYLVVVCAAISAIIEINWRGKRTTELLFFAAVAAMPVYVTIAQTLFLPYYRINDVSLQNISYGAAISLVLFFCYVSRKIPELNFNAAMRMVALLHIPILAFGAYASFQQWGVDQNGRLIAVIPTAVWGEIALGVLVAALLSESKLSMAAILPFVVLIIVQSQMRGAGLACAALLSTYFILDRSRTAIRLKWVLLLVGICVMTVFADKLVAFVSDALLLSDEHRGISSGFSGRFENWRKGFEVYLESPIIGLGPAHPDASYTHNGFLKVLAEYGILVAAPLFATYFYVWAIVLLRRDQKKLAILVAYTIFVLTAPRYINFQIAPLVLLFAMSRYDIPKYKVNSQRNRKAHFHAITNAPLRSLARARRAKSTSPKSSLS